MKLPQFHRHEIHAHHERDGVHEEGQQEQEDIEDRRELEPDVGVVSAKADPAHDLTDYDSDASVIFASAVAESGANSNRRSKPVVRKTLQSVVGTPAIKSLN